MTAAIVPARPPGPVGWVVQCPDGCRRHGGAFDTFDTARAWANLGRCCTATGTHTVHPRQAPSVLRRIQNGGFT